MMFTTQLRPLHKVERLTVVGLLFIMHLERIMDVIRDRDTGVRKQSHSVNNLKFVDDIDMIEKNRNKLP